jgi:hypothetical protein
LILEDYVEQVEFCDARKNALMTKHLITVVGGTIALLPQMLDHYRSLGVDSFLVYVHLRSPQDNVLEEVRAILRERGINVAGHRAGDWLDVQYQLLTEGLKKYQSDWFVIADQDELQIYPENLEELLNKCTHYGFDHVRGCFVDRFAVDGSLGPFDAARPVWDQFPIGSLFTFPILGGDPRKVVAARGGIAMTNSGHHVAIGGSPYPVDHCLVQVHHFKWMDGLLSYLRARKSQRWPDGAAISQETLRFITYLEKHGNKIDLSDPKIMAAPCTPNYPHWDSVVKYLKQVG